ncbi:MAG: DUF4976 domain-containing protein, partial [Phycisphaeraceae bacterium]|nr:DUF4976 domain-containing protein [Phycisphaeraceae bacterium]
VSGAMQSLVDFSPTFLRAAGMEAPGEMQGVSQLGVWEGREESARGEVIVENRHQPTKVHLRTYVDHRYKLTVYREGGEGEMFDLVEDPGENRNLWGRAECAGLKSELMLKFLQAEMRREPTRMRRVWGA